MPSHSRRILINYKFKIPRQIQLEFQDAEQSAFKLRKQEILISTLFAAQNTASRFLISNGEQQHVKGGGGGAKWRCYERTYSQSVGTRQSIGSVVGNVESVPYDQLHEINCERGSNWSTNSTLFETTGPLPFLLALRTCLLRQIIFRFCKS